MKCANHPELEEASKCISCGNPICENCRVSFKNEDYCKACIVRKAGGETKNKRSPGLAALLSFIIAGAGQIYNGQIGKGLLILFTGWLIIPWIYGIFDAYNTAGKINAGLITPKSNSGCLIGAIIAFALLFILIAFLGLLAAIAVPNFIKARKAAFGGQATGMPIIKKHGLPSTWETGFPDIDKRGRVKVFLKNGGSFEGRLVKESEESFVIKIPGGEAAVNKADIERIEEYK